MKKTIKFSVPILNFEYEVNVVISDMKTGNFIASKLFNEKGFSPIKPKNRGSSIYKSGHHPMVWVNSEMNKTDKTATLAHEAIHAVSEIMIYLGMDLADKSGNEFLAHSVAAIMRCGLKELSAG